MPDSNGNKLRTRLQNAKSNSASQHTNALPSAEPGSKALPPGDPPTTKIGTKVQHPEFGLIPKDLYCSLLRLDTNEKVWRPWGYATMALLTVMGLAAMGDTLLGCQIKDRMEELAHLQSVTTLKQLRGGYAIRENASGRWLGIPRQVLDSGLLTCGDQYLCFRVKSL